MKDLTINPSCLIYDAWLGSAAMPPDTTRNIMDLYSSSEEIYNAFFHIPQLLYGDRGLNCRPRIVTFKGKILVHKII